MKTIAHRGFSGKFKENSLESIKAAIMSNADIIEVDVQQCIDGIVINHNYFLNNGKKISDLTVKEAEVYNLLTLEKVLEVCKDKSLMLDLKQAGDNEKFIMEVCQIVARSKHFDCLIASFNQFHLNYLSQFRKKYGDIFTIGYITSSTDEFYFEKIINRYNLDNLIICKQQISVLMKITVDIPIYVFTINTKEELADMIEIGVDGIITDNLIEIK